MKWKRIRGEGNYEILIPESVFLQEVLLHFPVFWSWWVGRLRKEWIINYNLDLEGFRPELIVLPVLDEDKVGIVARTNSRNRAYTKFGMSYILEMRDGCGPRFRWRPLSPLFRNLIDRSDVVRVRSLCFEIKSPGLRSAFFLPIREEANLLNIKSIVNGKMGKGFWKSWIWAAKPRDPTKN